LEEIVKPKWKKNWVLFEDNDNAHGTRGAGDNEVKKAKTRLGIRWEANIANSLDFNPIERIWRAIKQRLKSRGIFYNIDDLRRAVEEEWDKLTLREINSAIENTLKVIDEVQENGGEMTGF
jgi:hypothetical protein